MKSIVAIACLERTSLDDVVPHSEGISTRVAHVHHSYFARSLPRKREFHIRRVCLTVIQPLACADHPVPSSSTESHASNFPTVSLTRLMSLIATSKSSVYYASRTVKIDLHQRTDTNIVDLPANLGEGVSRSHSSILRS